MSKEFTAIQKDFKHWLKSLKDPFDMTEKERAEATQRLTTLLNTSGVCLPKHGVAPGQFSDDGHMHIECGPKDNWGSGKWEIVVWTDGIVDATTYDVNLGGLSFNYHGSHIAAIIDNPQIAMDELQQLINHYEAETKWIFNNRQI